MERVRLQFFYNLGITLNDLCQLSMADRDWHGVRSSLNNAKDSIEKLFDAPTFIGELKASRPEAKALIRDIEQWIESTGKSKEAALSDDEKADISRISANARKFETVLLAEMENLRNYHASPKAAYATDILMEEAERVLPEEALTRVNKRAIDELRSCGRCLAFDNSTAAGFHAMRATEAVMHAYYIAVCRPKPKPARLDNWGAYLSELNGAAKDKPNVAAVVTLLQRLKDYRNDIMHPERVLSPGEALTVFNLAQAAIVAMAPQLPKPRAARKAKTNRA